MLPFSLCNKKRLASSALEQTPLSNDTIDSVLRHREVGRAKDLPVPPCVFKFVFPEDGALLLNHVAGAPLELLINILHLILTWF